MMSSLKHSKSELRDAVDNFSVVWGSATEATPAEYVYSTTVAGNKLSFTSPNPEDFGIIFKKFFKKSCGKSLYPNDFYFCMKRFVRKNRRDYFDMLPPSLFYIESFVNYIIDTSNIGFAWLVENSFISLANIPRLKYAMNKCVARTLEYVDPGIVHHFTDLGDFWYEFDTAKQPYVLALFDERSAKVIANKFSQEQLFDILNVHPHHLKYITKQTDSLVSTAVAGDGTAIRHAHRKWWSKVNCFNAVINNGYALKYMLEASPPFAYARDERLVRMAIAHTPSVAKYVSPAESHSDLAEIGSDLNKISKGIDELVRTHSNDPTEEEFNAVVGGDLCKAIEELGQKIQRIPTARAPAAPLDLTGRTSHQGMSSFPHDTSMISNTESSFDDQVTLNTAQSCTIN